MTSTIDIEIPEGETAHGMRRAGEGSAELSPACAPYDDDSGDTRDEDGDVIADAWAAQYLPTIVRDMPFETYLEAPAVSKSSLWTAITRSPAHARVEKEPSNAMTLGTAVHCAVLEPDAFAMRFVRGPDDRRGNRWKEALDEHGERLLTAGDYDAALKIRDVVASEPVLKRLLAGSVTEASGFWIDADTQLLCRCRPDAYNEVNAVMLDLKVTANAHPSVFRRRVAEFGYHAQEAFYTDGWRACGADVKAFVFLAIEPTAPYGLSLYEIEPVAVAEGREAMRKALAQWRECAERNHWPAYASGVQPLDLPKWSYLFTDPAAVAAE